jgi:hypothetical protein
MGADHSLASGQKPQRELVQVAGDEDHGIASQVSLDVGKAEVLVIYKDHLMTCDVYALPGEPLKVSFIGPRCRPHCTIPGDRKAIDWDPGAPNPQAPNIGASGRLPPEVARHASLGRISIEAIECPWELEDAGDHKANVLFSGMTLCRLRIAIDNNLAKDI